MTPLLIARMQMAMTLGFHIIFACLGVGMPILLLLAEGLYLKTGDRVWKELARRWSKSFAVLFAVGAVSGTVLAFELGLLWPTFMGTFGAVIGLPFTLEAFAFFLEAIFAGIYLYGWDRLSPRAHILMVIPIALAGSASAWFVVTANAWMNSPQGFSMQNGKVVDANPIHAMLNPATATQTAHMIIAAYMVTGFVIAAIYAFQLLKGRKEIYFRRAFGLSLGLGVIFAPMQILVGHQAAQMVAHTQPVKLAAMEGQFETEKGAPLRIGGLPDESHGKTRWAIEIPGLLSWLAKGDSRAEIQGLHDFLPEDRPPVAIVHLAFQVMVAIGTALFVLSVWSLVIFARRQTNALSKSYLRFVLLCGPLSVIALQSGWIVTEVGRQPWIVQGVMRTHEAVTHAPGIHWVFLVTMLVYSILSVGVVLILRTLARRPLESLSS